MEQLNRKGPTSCTDGYPANRFDPTDPFFRLPLYVGKNERRRRTLPVFSPLFLPVSHLLPYTQSLLSPSLSFVLQTSSFEATILEVEFRVN